MTDTLGLLADKLAETILKQDAELDALRAEVERLRGVADDLAEALRNCRDYHEGGSGVARVNSCWTVGADAALGQYRALPPGKEPRLCDGSCGAKPQEPHFHANAARAALKEAAGGGK